MKHRVAVPESMAVRLLVANQRACCICHKRKHLHIHHIDGNTTNNADGNLAPLCLDCHSHVTGDEGLGRRYTEAEVKRHKQAWEKACATPTFEEDKEDAEEPIPILYETALVGSEEEIAYEFDLDEGENLFASVSAIGYVDVMICDPEDYEEWCEGKDIEVYDDVEQIREKEFTFEAPQTGTYLLVLRNASDGEIEVTVEVAVSGAEGED